MKYKKFLQYILLIIILILSSVSCSYAPNMEKSDIVAPSYGENPLIGNWKVTNVVSPNTFSDDKDSLLNWLGAEVYFTEQEALINGFQYINPNYKIKTVNANEYFLNTYNVAAKSLAIEDDELKVITISVNQTFLNNFVIISEDYMVTYFDNLFIFLEKSTTLNNENVVTDDISKSLNIDSANSNNVSDENTTVESGILLSFKHYEQKDYEIPYSTNEETYEPAYRTIWIDFNGAYVKSIKELPYILLPRLSGFWKISTERTINTTDTENYIEDSLFASPIGIEIKNPETNYVYPDNNKFSSLLDIYFVGNDYISIEYNGTGFSSSQNRSYKYNSLRVLPIDTIYNFNETPVPITELMGAVGEEALQQGAISFLNSIREDERNAYENIPDNLSFGVERSEGKWTLIGRLNNSTSASKGLFNDFEIPTIPPKELVGYDYLYTSWNVIKEDFPDAIDAFVSPNKNFIVIMQQNKLEGYKISDGIIQSKKLFTFDLLEDEIPIMSQWSTGSYVNKWNETFTDLSKEK
ncbi:hypothetical protein [Clostridium sp. DL1XJH146]